MKFANELRHKDDRERFSPDYALTLILDKKPWRLEQPKCEVCNGTNVVYVRGGDSPAGGATTCSVCREAMNNWRFEMNAERSKGAIVDYALLQSLARSKMIRPEIVDLAKKGPHPLFVIGPTRTGKTLLLRYLYNRIIRQKRGVAAGAIYASEAQLFDIFRDDEKAEAFMAFCLRARDRHEDYYVFISDAFRVKQFGGRDSGRHYASIAWDHYSDWLDRFVLDRDVRLCVAANVAPRAVLNLDDPREAAIESRLREQSGKKVTWLDFEPQATAPAGQA